MLFSPPSPPVPPPQTTLNVGIGTVGVTSIFFGMLDKIENGKVFLGLSFALRIIEACGNSGFLTGRSRNGRGVLVDDLVSATLKIIPVVYIVLKKK